MGLMNKKAMIKLAMMLFLLSFIATIDARFDSTSFISQVISSNDVNSTTNRCCKDVLWFYVEGIPVMCQCLDIVETCESTCKYCTCKQPKRCTCDDYQQNCNGC